MYKKTKYACLLLSLLRLIRPRNKHWCMCRARTKTQANKKHTHTEEKKKKISTVVVSMLFFYFCTPLWITETSDQNEKQINDYGHFLKNIDDMYDHCLVKQKSIYAFHWRAVEKKSTSMCF